MPPRIVEPWDRQIGESHKAFLAFSCYRDAPVEFRTCANVANRFKKSAALMEKWCTEWNWVERSTQYDAYKDSLKREASEDVLVEMSRRHAEVAVSLLDKVVARLQKLNPSELSPRDLVQCLEAATKLERLSRGVETERTKTELSGPDGKPVEIATTVDFDAIGAELLEAFENAMRHGVTESPAS